VGRLRKGPPYSFSLRRRVLIVGTQRACPMVRVSPLQEGDPARRNEMLAGICFIRRWRRFSR